MPPNFLENIVILCFERRFSKQNSVIGLKSNILAPKIFGLATPLPGYMASISLGLFMDLIEVCETVQSKG